MIARHSLMQSGDGEGVEVVENKECFDEKYGKGQFTEKRIHLSRLVQQRILCRSIISFFFIVVCLIGYKQLYQRYFMSQRRHGTIIHIPLQNIQ